MKKTVCLLIILILAITMCSCAYSVDFIKSNLKNSGYEIIDLQEQQIIEMNNELKYSYSGNGSIMSGFYAVNNKDSSSITVLEFQNKSDLTIMYKMIKESLEQGESVDLSGNILIYGNENGVKASLK